MKAIVLKKFGGPEVLRWEDLPAPKPATGEILIKVHSVSVNRTLDCVLRAGKYPVKIELPHVLGADPAGEIAEVGDSVTKFKSGDRVAVISATPCQQCAQCLKGEDFKLRRQQTHRRRPLGRLRGADRRAGTLCGKTSRRNLVCGRDSHHPSLSHGVQSAYRQS